MRRYNIVDLFAGTGGMGLAALSAPCLKEAGRIVWTAENNPRYVEAIRRNYRHYRTAIGGRDQIATTCEAVDLSTKAAIDTATRVRARCRRVDIVLAGPPCQGFSLANRRSRTLENPLNKLSLSVLRYLQILEPRLFILENVPGIRTLRTSSEEETTTDILQRRLRRLGYSSTVMVLDAAAYGVPQFRLRSFLVAVKGIRDVFLPAHFVPTPTHGPGRSLPFTTVSEALSDLPATVNGSCRMAVQYKSDPRSNFQKRMREHSNGMVSDHLTSKHSPYVLRRYAKIPQGGNWTSLPSRMSNYTDPSRTHRNIYYRLRVDEPARTIGNFRKAMMIHPLETRGLSLREAARLQSIPDWIAFSNPATPITRGVVPGLNAYQQQIGNAVSYLLTEHLVSHVVQSLEL